MTEHDSLDQHDTGPSEPETAMTSPSAESLAELERLLLEAKIEQDLASKIVKIAGPWAAGVIAKAIAAG